jgi:hypothetical protein
MSPLFGVACFLVALAAQGAFKYALHSVIGIGTCASGATAYVIARPCPAGTGSLVAIIPISIFIAMASRLVALATLGARAATSPGQAYSSRPAGSSGASPRTRRPSKSRLCSMA